MFGKLDICEVQILCEFVWKIWPFKNLATYELLLISRVIKRIFKIKFEKYIHDVLAMFSFEFHSLRRPKREDIANLKNNL